jgi:hypothetical protein
MRLSGNAKARAGFARRLKGNPMTTHAKTMEPLAFADDGIEIDATVVAQGLALVPALFMELMQNGKITSRSEHGVDADSGRRRLTFFHENRRFQVIVDESGAIIQRSTIDFGDRPLPNSALRPRR